MPGIQKIKMEARTKVIGEKGKFTPSHALRKRVASFSNGVALGSEQFVKGVASRYQAVMNRKKERCPRTLAGRGGDFFVMKE